MTNSGSFEVDSYECGMDEHAELIIRALIELKGSVASKNQLYEHVRKYGGMPKKTFYKRLDMLEKCGLIVCHSGNPRLGISCELSDKYYLVKILSKIYEFDIPEEVSKYALPDLLVILYNHIVLNFLLALLLEQEDKVKIWLEVTSSFISNTLRKLFKVYSKEIPRFTRKERAILACILNEWRFYVIKKWLKVSRMDKEAKKEILRNQKESYERMKQEIKLLKLKHTGP